MKQRAKYLLKKMIRIQTFFLTILVVALFTVSCSKEVQKEQIHPFKVDAPSLKDNLLGTFDFRVVNVYLPPSYYNTTKRYPVIYYLNGFEPGYRGICLLETLDQLIKKGSVKECIMVNIGGENVLGGSFYVNSPVIGNWEYYIVKDLVKAIDINYRTIPDRRARAISGFSMGGFGAFNLAFRNPDVFSVTYIMAGGLMKNSSLKKAFDSWQTGFLSAYAAAFSPDITHPPHYGRIPVFDGSDKDNKIISDWENGFGNLKDKVEAYRKKGINLSAIGLYYSERDNYTWIPEGTRYLSKLLTERGIDHDLKSLNVGHVMSATLVENYYFDFVTRNLVDNDN